MSGGKDEIGGSHGADPVTDATCGTQLHTATCTFQRARQLKDGARPRVEPRGHTILRVALMEVTAGMVSWSIDPAPPVPPARG